jgi:epoxyqueuosine reductase QueG
MRENPVTDTRWKGIIDDAVRRFISDYLEERGLENIWRTPDVKYADAAHPGFRDLKKLVLESHFMPEDFLPTPRTVISYFLPFVEPLAAENVNGRQASDSWARAYNVTNEMAVHLNDHLVKAVNDLGYRAAVPQNIGTLRDVLKSRWSQRHVARLAGHGTFGLNNMMITEQGCTGRFFSVVADLPVVPDAVVTRERCLYKRNGTCGVCAARCVAGALTPRGFDRWKCGKMCGENEIAKGASVCGKCVVGIPCSFRCP